jgi:hypothetical protein
MLSINGDCLSVKVSYSGGCEDHTFDSCWNGVLAESDPPQARIWLDHDAMNDPCEAIESQTVKVDLAAVKAADGGNTGTVIIRVEDQQINYDW